MNAGGVAAAVMSPADRFGIGPGRHRRHAVDLLEAVPVIDEGRRQGRTARDVELHGVCGERVTLARKWGRYDYANPHLSTRRCERCGWIIALHLDTVEDEIASYTPDPVERGLITSTGHDPDLLAAIMRAVLAAHDAAVVGERLEPAAVSELLAHISRHRPIGVVCEGCWDGGGVEETHGVGATHCTEAIVACWACTFIAGSWAGEFEDTIGSCECIVRSPCSVLTTVAAHHNIDITSATGESR
ncbi:MAG: hypothetical protein CK429_32895 [Mycobacterium sp.]|nr:MAG: hypothetical protein CK429_32895 [Mycobacterium sp.]